MSDEIQKLLGKVGEGSSRASKYLDQLTPESREVLELFREWLLESDPAGPKSSATANAYKGYVAQALCHIQDGGDIMELSTDVRSGLNALKRFAASGVVEFDPDADSGNPDADEIDAIGDEPFDEDEDDVPASGDVE
jgi:hypothetical protein